ncbi:ComEC/Rec2 family competence protein [Williamsia deligens]|uniref:ComEC/Rec2 family competence protein n=1 Tax=Williamsia deligens TaxID=321325 RepID=A0ABW3G0C3_9NOCA|nr:ComEC/Rec2 family competence protein [Williamsia deligens]MCP2195101.1 Competence protein [Williamsia deligens]
MARPSADLRLVGPATGCWAATAVGVIGGWGAAASVCVVAVVVGASSAVVLRRRGAAHMLAWTVLAAAGVTAGFALAVTVRAYTVDSAALATTAMGHKTTVGITVTDDPQFIRGPGPARVRLAAQATQVGGRGGRVPVTVIAPATGWADLVPGQTAVAVVSVTRPRRRDLTAATLRAGADPRAVRAPPVHQRWAGGVRDRLATVSRAALGARESGLLPGMVIGDTAGLGDDMVDDFRRCGLTHLLAVSGETNTMGLLSQRRAVGFGPW